MVAVGNTVSVGHQIGTADNTGSSDGHHLHYTRYASPLVSYVIDPESLIDFCWDVRVRRAPFLFGA
jgi:murein DD-endopeptidase MepM/ murein hydrolase activator NlpD